MIIDFVRHGQSIANAEGWTAGAQDIALTQKGRHGALQLAHEMGEDGKEYDLIISSHLSRAHDTARYIAVAVGYDQSKIVVVDELCERYHGVFEDQPTKMADTATHEQAEAAGQETIQEFYHRISSGFDKAMDVARKQNAKRVLIVAHAGTYRVLKMIIDEMPLEVYESIERVPNTRLMCLHSS